MNRNQNKIYNIGNNNQNRRIMIPQNNQRMNQIPKKAGNPQKKQISANILLNDKIPSNNISNNNYLQIQKPNTNINNKNNQMENDVLSKAILMIKKDLKQKDDRIIELEKKVYELTNTLNSLLNNNPNISSTPYINLEHGEDINKKNGDIQIGMGGYAGLNNIGNIGNNKIRNNNFKRSTSQNNHNYNSDNENVVKGYLGNDNLSHSNDNSVLTYNGVQSNSKKEVKKYLSEVKTKIEPKKFKEFLRNIKLLTAKNNAAFNRDIIVENIRIIFGQEHQDLFIRFENIIGKGK